MERSATHIAVLVLCCMHMPVSVGGALSVYGKRDARALSNKALSNQRRAATLGPTDDEKLQNVVDMEMAQGLKGRVSRSEHGIRKAQANLMHKLKLGGSFSAIERSVSLGKPINRPLKGWSEADAPREVVERPDPKLNVKTPPSVPNARAAAANFVIITEHHSGINLLNQTLNINPKIQCGGELFAGDTCADAEDFECFRQKLAVLFEAKRTAGVPVPARGFVWMLDDVLQKWKVEFLKYLNAHQGRVLFLWRRNTLRRLLSHRAQGQADADAPVTLDAASLVARFDAEINRQHEAEAFFTAGLPKGSVLVRHFEDMQGGDVDTRIRRDVARWLAVPPRVTGHTYTRQQAPLPSLPRRIANYDQVATTLQGTAYEAFLENES